MCVNTLNSIIKDDFSEYTRLCWKETIPRVEQRPGSSKQGKARQFLD